MNQPFNSILFETKLALLKACKESFEAHQKKASVSVSCRYHGISLNFLTQDQRFKSSLEKFLPEAWISPEISGPSVVILKPAQLGISQLNWSSEPSQDCFTLDNNSVAIQRDFAAIFHGEDLILICDDVVEDGFFNFLRWYLSERLMAQDKFVIHAS